MKTLQMFMFLVFMTFTVVVFAQQSQDTTDALQDQRITRSESDIEALTENLSALTREMAGLRSSLDRFTGIGIGLGAALTSLQGILIIVTLRNGKKV